MFDFFRIDLSFDVFSFFFFAESVSLSKLLAIYNNEVNASFFLPAVLSYSISSDFIFYFDFSFVNGSSGIMFCAVVSSLEPLFIGFIILKRATLTEKTRLANG